MSDILIKGMRFPKTCDECLINCGHSMLYINITDRRSPDCPLVEIPTPHGRLIDADKFKVDYSMKNDCAECEKERQGSIRACKYDRIYSKMDFCGWLDDAETVIEAEGETDGR